MVGGSARCAVCHAVLGEIVALSSPGFGLFLAHGYVPIGDRAGLSAYGRRDRAYRDRRRAALRRGEIWRLPNGQRFRLPVADTRSPAISEPVAVYCRDCGALQRVARPPVNVAADPSEPTAEEVRMASA